MLVSIPPKYSVSQVIGFIKGKSAIHIARTYHERRANFTGYHFWARGFFVSTVGIDEEFIRVYIENQEDNDIREDQLRLFFAPRAQFKAPLRGSSIGSDNRDETFESVSCL